MPLLAIREGDGMRTQARAESDFVRRALATPSYPSRGQGARVRELSLRVEALEELMRVLCAEHTATPVGSRKVAPASAGEDCGGSVVGRAEGSEVSQ
jgi:hypothetical protein